MALHDTTPDERNVAVASHLAFLANGLVPFAGVIVPVLVLVLRPQPGFGRENAVENVNFQISVFLWSTLLAVTIVGILALPVVAIVAFLLPILAAMEAARGQTYRYPLTLRLVS